MKKDFAVFNKDGIPQYVSHMALESEARELPKIDSAGNIRVFITDTLTDEEILENCIYDVDNDKIVNIGKKPNENYIMDPKRLEWVFEPIRAKKRKSEELNTQCSKAISSGFLSNALGAGFFYPCRHIDQNNLNGSIVSSLLEGGSGWVTPFWCADSNEVWEMRPHSAEQIKRVGIDCKNHILRCQLKNAQLQAQANLALTEEELNSIVW